MAQLAISNHLKLTYVNQAIKDPKWYKAMSDEYDAIVHNRTLELVPSHPIQNLIGFKWIFHTRHYLLDLLIGTNFAWLQRGFINVQRVNYHDTFSPIVKPSTVSLILSLVASHGWSLFST